MIGFLAYEHYSNNLFTPAWLSNARLIDRFINKVFLQSITHLPSVIERWN